jgi:7,8-dihydropterin-6-yl-methyl-4-(beta-D-ribofuranosyl)aminobenzene 5'-phosphate synthase
MEWRGSLTMHEATIDIVVDNQASSSHGLCGEHGLAVWITFARRRILFDSGQKALFPNAEKLGIDLGAADLLVLSHGHYDHAGGAAEVIKNTPGLRVYLHPAALDKRFSFREGNFKFIGMPETVKTALGSIPPGNVHWVTSSMTIANGVGLSGPIPRLTEYEDTGGPFYLDAEAKISDPISDDLALWFRSDRGLVVVVGCSHAGLINTLHQVQQASGETQLHAVIGGFHLNMASELRLQHTVNALKKFAPEIIVPCHCTGDLAIKTLIKTFGEKVKPGFAGANFTFNCASMFTNNCSRKG